MPAGRICITNNNQAYKWYYQVNGKQSYLPKAEINLAKKLAFKKYLACKIKVLEQQTIQLQKKNKAFSKSESLIAIALAENNIPFRYENIIVLDDIEFAPDFTILHPRTNKLFYWEHFGMMDDNNYTYDFIHKMKYYSKNQIIMGDNLITTFESTTSPLNYTAINHLIQQYLS